MSKEKLYIDMPDDITMKAQIENIVEKGLQPKESFYLYLKNMYQQIGLRYLFHDAVEIIFAILLIISTLFFLVSNISLHEGINDGVVYAYLFTVSPILYLIISLLSFVNAKQNNTYEIEMTCKYDLYQVAAFRMLVFSIICILFNLVFVYAAVVIDERASFLRAFMISVTSLFLFSTFFLYIVVMMRSRLVKYLAMLWWVLLNFALWIFAMEFYILLLIKIPIYVYFVITTICIYVYIQNLKKLISFKSVRGEI